MRGGQAGDGPCLSGRGTANDPDIPQGRPRDIGVKSVAEFEKCPAGAARPARGRESGAARRPVRDPRSILSFTRQVADLLISGGLRNGEELAGTPALVDATLGNGHIVMFSFNPMWRHETQGSFFLVFNAMLNYKNLN